MKKSFLYSSCCVGQNICKCFDKLTPVEKKLIEDNSALVTYKKHEIICKQGGLVSHVMFLERGLVKVYLDNADNLLVLKIIPEGHLFGLTSLSEAHNTHQYSAMTYIDSEVRQIDIHLFRTLLKNNPLFAKEIIDIQNANSVQIYNRFFCLTYKQAFGRLADIILCLSERVFKNKEFDFPLSRKELAELSGLSSETVIRLLKKFTEDGLISLEGKMIKVISFDKLKNISDKG